MRIPLRIPVALTSLLLITACEQVVAPGTLEDRARQLGLPVDIVEDEANCFPFEDQTICEDDEMPEQEEGIAETTLSAEAR